MECKKSSSGYHLYFHMTGHCFYCSKYLESENYWQKREEVKRVKKQSPGKLGVFKIGRLCIYQGCWEVRGENEKKSKWLPFKYRKDAVEFLEKKNNVKRKNSSNKKV
jgi:hypothetical protein